ncbi:MAG: hypothetical protein ABS34_12255 [Opitutaceae bacterium BACL24 MAG-120322-bin51]|jgi:DNA-binding transcriptional regulator YiaG|nr:MAG: hypothetical protein ABS34_12255 [Opitutaceae bacterium BACL24 MAG-120322-bin51]
MKDYIDNFRAIPNECNLESSWIAREEFYKGARADVAAAIEHGLMSHMTFEEYMEEGKSGKINEMPADVIRSIRESKLTRSQLARKHNVCISNISKIRNNRLRDDVV